MRTIVALVLLILAALASACGPSSEAVATQVAISAKATFAAWTPTATTTATTTSTSTATATATLAATSTPIPPTLAPTPTSVPTATPDPNVLLYDDFSSLDISRGYGWSFSSSSDGAVVRKWAPNRFEMGLTKTNWVGYSYPQYTYADFGAEIEAEAVSTPAQYGIVFRVSGTSDERSYYVFYVGTDGSYRLTKNIEGKWADKPPVPWTQSKSVHMGSARNRLGILAQASTLALYINGDLVNTVSDESLDRGNVGVLVGTGDYDRASVAFYRMTIWTPEQARLELANKGTPVAPSGSLASFAIQAPEFEPDNKENCTTDAKITSVNGTSFTTVGTLTMRNNKILLWCYGAKHTWTGTLTYAGYTFASDSDDPLQFMVDRDAGYVYVKGKGTLTRPDRSVVRLPLAGGASSAKPTLPPRTVGASSATPPLASATSPANLIRLSPGKFKGLFVEVLAGQYKLKSSATLLKGSAIDVTEDLLTFDPDLAIDIGDGGATFKGKTWPVGARLIIDSSGNPVDRKP